MVRKKEFFYVKESYELSFETLSQHLLRTFEVNFFCIINMRKFLNTAHDREIPNRSKGDDAKKLQSYQNSTPISFDHHGEF